jgi:hypothetical protein
VEESQIDDSTSYICAASTEHQDFINPHHAWQKFVNAWQAMNSEIFRQPLHGSCGHRTGFDKPEINIASTNDQGGANRQHPPIFCQFAVSFKMKLVGG